MKKWRCVVCNYIHYGETPPDICPECGVGPDKFVLEGEVLEEGALSQEERDAVLPAIFKISYGMYVVSSYSGDKINAQVCNTAVQVTSDPIQVAIGINKSNLTHAYILESGKFAVHVLCENDINTVRRFGFRSGRDADKFAKVNYVKGKTGCPILEDGVMGFVECSVVNSMDCGTHTMFLGRVFTGKLLHDSTPMTYAYYRANK